MNLNLIKLNKTMSTDKVIKLQDKQLDKLNNAKQLIQDGDIEKGIGIIEKITYEEGGIIFNSRSWPMYLAEVLFKNKMYDRCWRYLNAINLNHLDCIDKIRKMQAKISTIENRPKDAIYQMISSIVYQYHNLEQKPNNEEIKKIIKPYLKNVSIKISEDDLFALITKFMRKQNIDEREIKEELISILE